eukprot:4207200-Prymnesium_polylepis.1
MEEVMRSCGGAVQGLREVREARENPLTLNRADDGFCFFDDGTWAQAPDSLDAADADLLRTPETFGLSVCIGHETARRRLDLAIVDSRLAVADLAFESLAAAD